MVVWVVLVCVVVCGYAALCYRWRHARAYFAKLPTFHRLPVLGNLHRISGDGRALFRILVQTSEAMETNGLPFVIWLGPCPIMVISDPDDVKAITNTSIERPYLYSFAKICFGDSLITAPGHIWKHSIKKLGGIFTTRVVDGYLDVFNAQAQKLVQQLKACVGKEPFDVSHDVAFVTLEAIFQTALGMDCTSDNMVTTEYFNALCRSLELFVSRALNVLMYPDFIYRLTPAYKELLQCVSVLHNYSRTVVKKRKQEWEDNKNEIQKDEDPEGVKMKSYLDILMELHESDPTFTEERMRSEVDTIISGGQETVTATVFYTLLMLGCNKHVQDKLYAEIKEIFGDSTRPVEKEDLAQLKYCEAVLYETMRLYPAIPAVLRNSEKELQLKSCRVPSNTTCAINVWAAGRSRRAWGPDAEEFKPERWLHEEPPPGYPASFLAFSCGRRACIGKRYAMVIMKTMLATCIRELEIESEAHRMEMRLDITLRAISGHLIQVRLRK